MKTFYYLKPLGKGLAAIVLVSCGVASVVAPCLTSKEGLAIVESLNSKLVRASELIK